MELRNVISKHRRGIFFIAALVLFLIVLALPTPAPVHTGTKELALTIQGKATLAVLLFSVLLWVTEAIPFSVTGFLAIALLVMTKAAPFKKLVSDGFGDPIILFFIGVCIFSAAINSTVIMKRITTHVLHYLGHNPSLIILAFLIVGMLMSAWITDMAVAAMLLPIGVSILKDAGAEPLKSNFGRALMISCAWGALIGGIATPAGCGPNPLTMGFLKDLAGIDFTFLDWMAIGFPAAILMVPCAWLILLKTFPLEDINLSITKEEVKQRFADMGPIGRKEIFTIVIFLFTIFLWIFAPFIKQWTQGVIDYLDISFVAIACACLLFMPGIEVLSWEEAENDISWGGIILVVAGLSLGMAIYHSGAADWIAWMAFHSIGKLHPVLIVLTVVLGVSLMKVMFSSNTVTGIIVVPLLIALGRTLGIDPVLLAVPAGITSSLAFILVTSTPTNVIPYSSGYFTIGDMAKAGIWMTILGSLCTTLSICGIGKLLNIIAF
jgi:sodium-dependent dicarboxylate transporter 2/3/5